MFESHAPADLRELLTQLAKLDGGDTDEGVLVDTLTAMERLKSGLAAAQARVTATLATKRNQAEAARGVAADQRCRGLAAEIAFARRESPFRGGRHLGLAKALAHEMPHTLAALTRGDISEFRATLMVQETAVLTVEHRSQVDAELAGRLASMGDRQVAAEARKIGYRLDPGSVLRRTRGAREDRRVSLRPAPDTMSNLTGFLPVEQGVACKVALEQYADRRRSEGDTRTRGQIMADAMFERLTGQSAAEGTNVEIHLVMTDQTLFGGDHAPAQVVGHGPIPAFLARQIVRKAHRAWLRRLFSSPDGASLVAMDSRRRIFDGLLRRFVVIRDEVCRTPWCDAPIRHVDHPHRAVDGGQTSEANAQGLCEACNYAKEADGWDARRLSGHRHQVETTTPTGHRHRSRAPSPVGHRVDLFTPGERRARLMLAA